MLHLKHGGIGLMQGLRARFSARNVANRSALWAIIARDMVMSLLKTAHHTLSLLGLGVLLVLSLVFLKPEMAHQIRANAAQYLPALPHLSKSADNLASATSAAPASALQQTPIQQLQFANSMDMPHLPAHQDVIPAAVASHGIKSDLSKSEKAIDKVFDRTTLKQQQWVTNWLSKRYRVAGDAAHMLVSTTYLTAKEIKIDPLLILAVMAIESGFNPFAESPMGAQGLMQVMSKVHHDKFADFGGVKQALNPHANIRVGALILKDYMTRGGSVEAGLKSYVGAGAFDSDTGYGARVLAEYQRLKEVANGKHLSPQTGATIPASVRRTEEAKTETKVGELAAL